jgi:tetratricopeptide (TPR) repeat protein
MDSPNYYERGIEKAKKGDYLGAIDDFNLAEIAVPNGADVRYRRGLAYFDLGQIHEAISDYTKAIEFDKYHRDAFYARALARLGLKNFSGALTDVESAIANGRDYAPAYELKGIINTKLARRSMAIDAYKMAANLYLHQGNIDGSKRAIERAKELQPPLVKDNPTQIEDNSDLGTICAGILVRAQRGEIWEAIADCDRYIRTYPQDERPYICRGTIHLRRQDIAAALLDFNYALKLAPTSLLALRMRSKARMELKDYGGAIADIERSIDSDEKDFEAYILRGEIRVRLQQFTEATADFTKAIELQPLAANAYIKRAEISVKLEELSDAILDYQAAANLYLDWQEVAKYQETIATLDRLQKSFKTGSKSSDRDRQLRDRLLQLVGGHWELAERLIEQLRERYPDRSEEWYMQEIISGFDID